MRCYRCKEDKQSIAFPRDKSRKRGFNVRCTDCDVQYRREKRKKNPEHYRLKDKQYNLRHKKERNAYSREYNKKNKHKILAHYLVHQAIKAGLLIKRACEVCNDYNTEAHHDDYSNPLIVRWLCRNHHRLATHNIFI